jgi:hypothetical protein
MSWFFDRPFAPGEEDMLAGDLAAWLRSPSLRRLVEGVPGSREPGATAGSLRWPDGLDKPGGADLSGLLRALDGLGGICDWALPGTVWDFREAGERRLDEAPRRQPPVSAAKIADLAAALGLRSEGALEAEPTTLVILGGRRLAPLNRARAAAGAIGRLPREPRRVVMLCGRRSLDPAERESAEVRGYAPGATTELDLMAAAAGRVFAPNSGVTVEMLEIADPAPGQRASTYETLRDLAATPEAGEGPLAIVTSPTCRPFQYLEAVRALGLRAGRGFELIAHPPAWAAASSPGPAQPHVYLQEIRSVIQASGRLAEDLAAVGASSTPTTSPA